MKKINIKKITMKIKNYIQGVLLSYFIYIFSPFAFISKNYFINKIFNRITLKLVNVFFVEKLIIHYDPKILNIDKMLLISNHVNFYDWFIIYNALYFLNKKKIVFVAKYSLKFYSYIISKFYKIIEFICIKRKLSWDYISLVKCCKNLGNFKEFCLIIFPEGTLITRKKSTFVNICRSTHRNRPTPKNVMMPKTKGTSIILENLILDGVIDCTLDYSIKHFSLINFLRGKRIIINVYLECKEVPKEKYEEWLIDIFNQKDEKMSIKTKSKELLSINLMDKGSGIFSKLVIS
jgi:1-acyl-sn-glycerol-3-phosphate acyltransferase